ncbi:hypothetical protein Asp14428_04800 [Actinoplanes sp. NBRC 14428]|nr:hypothetical protein Asp14428_04800 [Actinoplanes sp. NBRC 14428]
MESLTTSSVASSTCSASTACRSRTRTSRDTAIRPFTWPRGALPAAGRLLPPRDATATASPSGDNPAAAVDGDASTRWSSAAAQAPGQYLRADFGTPRRFREIAVDSGDNLGDYARSWELAASNDGTHWRTLATGRGTGQLTTVRVPPTRARYVRITNTGTSPHWWSIADLRLYR